MADSDYSAMQSPKRIAVIGAGSSGLTAIKCCKEEGMAVSCFERTDSFGGRWCYRNTNVPGVASVMKSTVSIHSKEMMAFSDFPPPASFPNYMHHSKVLEYLRLYAEEFDLLRHVRYQQEVKHVTPAAHYNKTGKWIVTSVNVQNITETDEFDGVMICTGRLAHPILPSFPNQEMFKGKILHSWDLKVTNIFENLHVVIVGNGNSAMDAAADISVLAKQVYLSTRSGTWILPKVGPKGLPFDMTLLRRFVNVLKKYFSTSVNNYLEQYLERRFQHDVYQLKPEHRALEKPPAVNDIIPDRILTGRVRVKGTIAKFEENSVLFEGDEYPTETDVTIFATGYELKIPVSDNNLYKTTDGLIQLYKGVFPFGLEHPTLAIIGFVKTQGPLGPVAENQSRWVAKVFNRKLNLQYQFVDNVSSNLMKKYQYLQEDYMEYMDALAEEYSAKPDLSTLLFKDPHLYWKCITGPCLPYQYRINGSHTWEGARMAILESYKRVIAPLSTNFCSNKFVNNNNMNGKKGCCEKSESVAF